DDNKIRLKSTAGFYPNAWVEVDRGLTKLYRRVKSVDGTVLTLEGPALVAGDVAPELAAPDDVTILSTCEFRLALSYAGVVEQFAGLTLENVPDRYYVDRINNGSTLINVGAPAAGNTHPFFMPSGDDGLRVPLTGGSDGGAAPTDLDYKGADGGPGQRT